MTALEDAIAAVMTSTFPEELMDHVGVVEKGSVAMGTDKQNGAAQDSTISGYIILTNAKYSDLDEQTLAGYAPTAYSVIAGGATGEWVISNTGNTYTFTSTSAEQGDWKSVPEPTSGVGPSAYFGALRLNRSCSSASRASRSSVSA